MLVRYFFESLHDVTDNLRQRLVTYIKELPESHFDAVDRKQFSELAAAKFRIGDMPTFATGEIHRDAPVFTQGSDEVSITVYFPYQGDPHGFRYYDSSHPMTPPMFEERDGLLAKTYSLSKKQLHTLDELVDQEIRHIQQYVSLAQKMIPNFNATLVRAAGDQFDRRIHEIEQNRLAMETVSKSRFTVRKRNDGAEKVILPIKREPIDVPAAQKSDPLQEYVLGMKEYDDILATISSMVLVMERSPSVFAAMNEEPLRTILLVALNGIYEGQASGETFNGAGKTDILIRRDNHNVFIAECLMWRGPEYLKEKMDDQLFQYAMWRDSKIALIVFNRGTNFSHVISSMKETIKSHRQFVNELTWAQESGARYAFRRHDDPQRQFVLTALAFDIPSGE